MPQMNPMWWFSLFISFSIILVASNSLNYFYSNNPSYFSHMNNKNIYNLNWKW